MPSSSIVSLSQLAGGPQLRECISLFLDWAVKKNSSLFLRKNLCSEEERCIRNHIAISESSPTNRTSCACGGWHDLYISMCVYMCMCMCMGDCNDESSV
jgi:hypothetical protein